MLSPILGLLIVLAALGALARLARGHSTPGGARQSDSGASSAPANHAVRPGGAGSPYRAGPWPGLNARGAGLLLSFSWMLLGGELLLPKAQREARALPDLVLLAAVAVIPALLGTCLVQVPGCASAVCGVYLLGRSLPSLIDPSVEPPPLLLPGAVACDLVAWVRRADLWPPRGVWRRRLRSTRNLTGRRAALAGAAFTTTLALVEPPYALLLGSDPGGWGAGDRLLAAGLAALAGFALGAGLERITKLLQMDDPR
jgi:hypothetical protein